MSKIIKTSKLTNAHGISAWRIVIRSHSGDTGCWALWLPESLSRRVALRCALKAAQAVDKGLWSRDDAKAWA